MTHRRNHRQRPEHATPHARGGATPGDAGEDPHGNAAPALTRRIQQLRELAAAEPRLEGVLLYGSWTLGEADQHSDLEAYLFVRDEHLPDAHRPDAHRPDGAPQDDRTARFDGRAFLRQLAPLKLAYTNMYGILAVIFDDLMRGEFHLEPAGHGIEEIASWQGLVHLPNPEAAVLLDRSGRLARAVAPLARFQPPQPDPTARQLANELANWTLLVAQLLARGETARAHAFLHGTVATQQLQLCRLLRGSTVHWLTPSRALETDLPVRDVRRYTAATAPAEPVALRAAARNSWAWSRELTAEAADRWGTPLPQQLPEEIGALLADG